MIQVLEQKSLELYQEEIKQQPGLYVLFHTPVALDVKGIGLPPTLLFCICF